MTSRLVTIFDIAKTADVSLATADRALNRRKGVAPKTAKRVLDAAAALGWTPDVVAQSLSRRELLDIQVILPMSENPFVLELVRLVGTMAGEFRPYRLLPHLVLVPERDPHALAAKITELANATIGFAILGLDEPAVAAAVDAAVERGKIVVTLVSDIGQSRRHAYVGIDNVAAGRTAATLMGRLVNDRAGRIAVFAGDKLYADLVEREHGFGERMDERFATLVREPSLWSVEDDADAETAARHILDRHADLTGIYVAGGGMTGVARALTSIGREHDILVIGHDLVGDMPALLRSGVVDVAISQDPRTQVVRAMQTIAHYITGAILPGRIELTDIDIFLPDNLPASIGGVAESV